MRNRPRQNGDIHVQEAQNAVMLEQDRLMDRIQNGEERLDRSDDEIICALSIGTRSVLSYSLCVSRFESG